MFGVGPLELLIVLFIFLMIFGAKKLPQMGRDLGGGMREFKENIVNPVNEGVAEVKSLPAGEAKPVGAVPQAGEYARD
jgi:sec-independent protein translocase protein TatA